MGAKKVKINQITLAGNLATDAQQIANGLNEYFQSVFTRNTHNDVADVASYPCACPMALLSFNQEGVFQQLLNLDSKKASGTDKIPMAFLKQCAEWMSFYLVIILEKSLRTHSLPDEWLCAAVIPVFKSGNRLLPNNYRPIFLTSACCKVLEHVITKHIMHFLEANKLLYANQNGFRWGLSTVTQLVETVHDFSVALDEQRRQM